MAYKCEYNGKVGCENCKFDMNYSQEALKMCEECTNECPATFHSEPKYCEQCNFTQKEREENMRVDFSKAFDGLKGLEQQIKDSGERREFETGAVRDMASGKGLMVVMPAAALLRLSKHYEHGAQKYGKWNYNKGIPVDSFIDSALRHLMKYLDGWDDEDHLAAAAFNILGAMEMEAHKPDMQNIPAREGKQSFNYVDCLPFD